MATTAGGLPYVEPSDLVSGWPAVSQDLAEELDTQLAGKLATPPAWTAWTPTIGGAGWAFGDSTVNFAYALMGKVCVIRGFVTWGSTATFGATALTFSLPPAAQAFTSSTATPRGSLTMRDASASTSYSGACGVSNAQVVTCQAQIVSGTNVTLSSISSTVPFTLAATDQIAFSVTYQTT